MDLLTSFLRVCLTTHWSNSSVLLPPTNLSTCIIPNYYRKRRLTRFFLRLRKKIASEDLRTFGIHLGCQDHKISSFVKKRKNVQDAAYDFLLWAEEKYADDAKMWKKLIEALEILEKNRTIKKLRLRELLTAAQEKNPVIITVRKRNYGNVMFSQACVKNSVQGRRCTPPSGQTSPWVDTPSRQTPPLGRHPTPWQTPPQADTLLLGRHPPIRMSLQRTVRILMECILVYNSFVKYFLFKWKLD